MVINSALFPHLAPRKGMASPVCRVQVFPMSYIRDLKMPIIRGCLTIIPGKSSCSNILYHDSQRVPQPTEPPASVSVHHLQT